MTVELRGFGWRHAGRTSWAVRGIDLRIEPGERVLLLGPSGAGKSTLLSAIAGLLPADSGTVEGTVTVAGSPPTEVRGRVGLVFQDPHSQIIMARAGDDVAFGLENLCWPRAAIWPRVDEVMAEVGFLLGRDRQTSALSGGQRQRLAIAGVLASRPQVLLLDEPTANLDPVGALEVRSALAALAGGCQAGSPRTMMIVEHRVAEVLPLVNRVVVLSDEGGITADGSPDAVLARHGEALAARGVWVPGAPLTDRQATTPPGEDLLTARGVGYLHPGATAATGPVDLTAREGEALALCGPNGSGKSTLAFLLGGLLAPTTGTVTGSPALGAPEGVPEPHRWRASDLAGRIGTVFQNPEHQFLTSRVDSELALGPSLAQMPAQAVATTVDELLARMRLAHLASANPHTLSGGERRRLAVATALARAPRVLVLDEPTFGQDRRTWLELVDLLVGLRAEGRAIVLATHDLDLVTAMADRVHQMGVLG